MEELKENWDSAHVPQMTSKVRTRVCMIVVYVPLNHLLWNIPFPIKLYPVHFKKDYFN